MALQKNKTSDHETIAGSPLWMAPEAIRGVCFTALLITDSALPVVACYQQASPKSDVWSLGITAIEIATGSAPLQGLVHFPAIASAIVTQPAPELKKAFICFLSLMLPAVWFGVVC